MAARDSCSHDGPIDSQRTILFSFAYFCSNLMLRNLMLFPHFFCFLRNLELGGFRFAPLFSAIFFAAQFRLKPCPTTPIATFPGARSNWNETNDSFVLLTRCFPRARIHSGTSFFPAIQDPTPVSKITLHFIAHSWVFHGAVLVVRDPPCTPPPKKTLRKR